MLCVVMHHLFKFCEESSQLCLRYYVWQEMNKYHSGPVEQISVIYKKLQASGDMLHSRCVV